MATLYAAEQAREPFAEAGRTPAGGALPFLAGGQAARFARCEHAAGVGVAAARAVALGGHQHVLAERGKVVAAERTAIRGGLAVLRAADRPPAGSCKIA